MRRLWFLMGLGIGALFVWSWLHKERKDAQLFRQQSEGLEPYRSAWRTQLAMDGIEQGVDFTDEAWWEQELAQYKDLEPSDLMGDET